MKCNLLRNPPDTTLNRQLVCGRCWRQRLPFHDMRIRRALPGHLGKHLKQLITDIEHEQGASPFGEILLHAMETDRACIGLVAEQSGAPIAYGYATPGPDGKIWSLEVAADRELYSWFLERMLDQLEQDGVAEAVLWIYSPMVQPPKRRVIPERSLYRMSVRLPIADPTVPDEGVVIRGFDTKRDGSMLIELNNRAFKNHPEQGGWTADDLETRVAFEWFDPDGVRTAWLGSQMAAFNWTKVHKKPGPNGEKVGEIYSIAVHPSFQKRGLGRMIAVEGLRHLAARRGADTAILHVDSSNAAALELYRSLGFVTDHVDRAYRWQSPRTRAFRTGDHG